MTKQMKLGALLHIGGQHIAAWRHPEGVADAGFNLSYYTHLAAVAEAGKFDLIFVADANCVRDWPIEVLTRCAQMTLVFEPLTLMAALSAVTSHIGFVVTGSTAYAHPYQVARQFASFDVLSGGRAAWNVVTGAQMNEAANFGATAMLDHTSRYRRAAEFVDVVRGLWATSEHGVVIADKAAGRLFDPALIHSFHHRGENFTVDGILNVPPSPQGRPLIAQAGASGPGRDLAANVADIIFAASPMLAVAQEYYGDMKQRIEAAGRRRDSAVILPGIIPVIGATRDAALAKIAELDSLIHPQVSLTILSDMLGGVDLSPYPLDGPMPDLGGETNKSKTMVDMIRRMAGQDNMSMRQTAAWVAATMTHLLVAGTAEDIADLMQHWFENGACDGFMVSPLLYPSGLEEFVEKVVPILQARGLFRTDYEGTTLRQNLGLGRDAASTQAPAARVRREMQRVQ